MIKQFYLAVTLFGFCLTGTILIYTSYGASALSFIGVCVSAIALYSVLHVYKLQETQANSLLIALSHGDTSLGLKEGHPLRQQFIRVQQQLQGSRMQAEQQAQFFQSLLTHIDLAVIVVNDHGEVLEHNPGVARLLGRSVKHLSDLDALGERIATTQGNQSFVMPWLRGDYQDTLSIALSVTDIQGQILKLITLQSIREQLQNKEQQAYKTLTKVLTHEVANSITPLSSLAQTCESMLPASLSFASDLDKQDLQQALSMLAARTKHLGAFIQRFRKITALPAPLLQPLRIKDVINHVVLLFRQQLNSASVDLTLDINSNTLLMADKAQLEQVLINLIKNALEAMQAKASGHIAISAGQLSSGQVYIDVLDSGPGIISESAAYVFVPFYSTKQSGSGIGLSLAQQIMLNHGGELLLLPAADKSSPKLTGAHFRMLFSV